MVQNTPVLLIILDGWGINPNPASNAVEQARLPFYKSLLKDFPNCLIMTSGESVGLPNGQMGNSEVGHLNIGAGRVVYQDLMRINKSISDKSFFKNKAFLSVMEQLKQGQKALHLMGLVSDGGVHSHIQHLFALLEMAKKTGLEKIFVHAFLDGRDTQPKSSLAFIQHLIDFMKKQQVGQIATVSGRYYAMDRDKRWDRVQKAYDAIVLGAGAGVSSPLEAIKQSYQAGKTDEFLNPIVITREKNPVGPVEDGDGIIFFNFRADRARELTQAFTSNPFNAFPRKKAPDLAQFVTMTQYDETFNLPCAFSPYSLNNLLGELISQLGMKQLRIAETEKYAHVTYFFNGGKEKVYPGEERILIQSPKDVPTYDLKPQMSAPEVTGTLIAQIKTEKFQFIVLNLANPDMVGHTGSLPAAIKAAETIDRCLEEIITTVKNHHGTVMITADHGNLEQMEDYQTGEPHTAHTTFPVPFILISDTSYPLRERGVLADIAPTVLEIMGIPKPSDMTGESLIKR
ncbi:MAG: 2,3-bisphosphoglycerate-independent phosphoglycerate mutase [Nitrospirae bacterium]|nr:2,3-bisphosphoglycerate-independent phosphoglycerate mutase [Nitrospirota bacterium]MBI3351372.1 2,3-bisphosphoglycerate-independent phosphoglycerate mutase [Nitrospirota bacterium]